MSSEFSPLWLAVAIGNSRIHWARFAGQSLLAVGNCFHFNRAITEAPFSSLPQPLQAALAQQDPVLLASVVPAQTAYWQDYPRLQQITLPCVPLSGLYATLGCDRALVVLGAGQTRNFPCLVIDGGTALTLTGADDQKVLQGGAILPGLRLQLQTLATQTAALPAVELPPTLPPRWGKSTAAAIQSGVIYTVLGAIADFVTDWRQQFPGSALVLTGGDGAILQRYLQAYSPSLAAEIAYDPYLLFWGMRYLFWQNASQ